ncbi:MAG: CotH kinase family protein [Bryobacteraceae bacterium]
MIRNSFLFPVFLFFVVGTFAQAQINQFIDDTVVQQISLTVAPADWAAFLQNYLDSTYYHATFVWNGVSQDIGIRQHGGGSRSPIKPNIDLNFAHYTSSQTFFGENLLILKANNEDPSNLHEWISMKLFRKMGFPAPRESFATVTVNGTLLGFYMIVEHDDPAFAQRNYGESSGSLYEWQNQGDEYDFGNLGTNPQLYAPYLELKSNQSAPDLQTFTNLVQVINQPSSSTFTNDQFITALEQYLDPQMFLTYAATENVLSEADGLVGGLEAMNNFDFYQFQGTTIYALFPWDKDLTFDNPSRDIFQGFTIGPYINVLAARLIAIPGYKNIYMDQINRAANLFGGTGAWADSEITREYGVINTASSNDPNKQCLNTGVLLPCGTADFESGIAWVHTFIGSRSPFVLAEIAANGYQVPSTDPVIQSVSTTGLTSSSGMSPGTLVQVDGSLLGAFGVAKQYPLPRSLANTFVAIEGVRAPLFFATSGQIELQVPWDIPTADAAVVVSANGSMSNSFASTMQASTPVILAVAHDDGSLVSSESPAVAGEGIVIYMTGLGTVNAAPALGSAASGTQLANTTVSPQVSLGNVPLAVGFSGLAPGTAALYQVNATLPQPLGQTGSAGLNFSLAGQTASTTLPLQ